VCVAAQAAALLKLAVAGCCWWCCCRRGQTAVIAAIEARIAEWTRLPPDHGEPIQVLRYQNGQKYDAHWVGT
jgi:hypothetical protein